MRLTVALCNGELLADNTPGPVCGRQVQRSGPDLRWRCPEHGDRITVRPLQIDLDDDQLADLLDYEPFSMPALTATPVASEPRDQAPSSLDKDAGEATTPSSATRPVLGPIRRTLEFWITPDETYWRALGEAKDHHAGPNNGGPRYQALLRARSEQRSVHA